MKKTIPKLPKCIQGIRKKYPNGIFKKEDFSEKIKKGTSFYHVGSIYGNGPMAPQKMTYSHGLKSGEIKDLLVSYKGVFLKETEALNYYRAILTASITDDDFRALLRAQKNEQSFPVTIKQVES